MSVEKMREEFEAHVYSTPFYAYQPGDPLDIDDADGGYLDANLHGAWLSWQASRAALVVELPAIEAWDNDGRLDREKDEDADVRIGLVPRVDVRAAIEAAGVTVK